MRKHRANKSYNSRLTRWVDRLLPFDFTIDHLPGSKMGLVDYISREPQQKAVNISAYDEQFIVAKLDAIKRSAKPFYLFCGAKSTYKTSLKYTAFHKLCSEFTAKSRIFCDCGK